MSAKSEAAYKAKEGYVFSTSEKERATIDAWVKKHLKVEHKGKVPDFGAIGGAFGYTFIPTGLGNVVIVYCGACKGKPEATREHNATDFDCW